MVSRVEMAVYTTVLALITANFLLASICQLSDIGDSLENSVFFTITDLTAGNTSIQYAKATPVPEDFETEFYKLTSLYHTSLDVRDEYWGLAASYENRKIFWNSYSKGELYEFDVADKKLTVLLKFATAGLESIAYDHVTKVLYWTDSKLNAIFATEAEDKRILRIYESGDIPPHALAIHTTKRKMFFSEHLLELDTLTQSRIARCDLDGENVETILKFPSAIAALAITIDYGEDKLYWTDRSIGGNAIVAASDLDGTRRREFFSSSNGGIFTGIAYHNDLFYVVDALNSTSYYEIHVRYRNTRRGKRLKSLLRPRNVAIYAPNEATDERIRNECERSRCDHLCLASFSGGFTCKCTEGYKLIGTSRCQTDVLQDEFLLVSDIGQTSLFQLSLRKDEDNDLRAFPFKESSSDATAGMTLNPKNGDLVWYNPFKKMIIWGKENIPVNGLVVSMKIHPCLQRLFWITSTEMYSWAQGEDSPTLIRALPFFTTKEMVKITLDVKRDHVYCIEYNELAKASSVFRIHINGSGEEVVLENMPVIQGIDIYFETYTLYVMSLDLGILFRVPLKILERIPTTDPNHSLYGNMNISDYTDSRTIQDMVVVNGYAYFSVPRLFSIQRFNLALGPESMENFGTRRFFFPIELAYYRSSDYKKILGSVPGCRPDTTVAATTVEVTTTEATEIDDDNKPVTSHPCNELLTLNFQEDSRILAAYLMCRLRLNPGGVGGDGVGGDQEGFLSLLRN